MGHSSIAVSQRAILLLLATNYIAKGNTMLLQNYRFGRAVGFQFSFSSIAAIPKLAVVGSTPPHS